MMNPAGQGAVANLLAREEVALPGEAAGQGEEEEEAVVVVPAEEEVARPLAQSAAQQQQELLQHQLHQLHLQQHLYQQHDHHAILQQVPAVAAVDTRAPALPLHPPDVRLHLPAVGMPAPQYYMAPPLPVLPMLPMGSPPGAVAATVRC